MALAIVGSPANVTFNTSDVPSAALTPGAGGSDLIAIVSYTTLANNPISALALSTDGALTKRVNVTNNTLGFTHAEVWTLGAAPTNSSQTVSKTSPDTYKDIGITFITVSGSNVTISTTNTDAHDAGTNLNAAVSCAVGDLIVAAAGSSRQAQPHGTWANSFTSDLNANTGNGRAGSAHKIAVGTTETANVQVANGLNTHSAALAVAVITAASGGSTSLGARRIALLGVG